MSSPLTIRYLFLKKAFPNFRTQPRQTRLLFSPSAIRSLGNHHHQLKKGYLLRYVPCCAVHPSVTSGRSVPLDRFITVSKWIYSALHFIPALIFRRKAFAQHPFKEFVKTGLGSLWSFAFLGAFFTIYQGANVSDSFTFEKTILIHPS